MKDINTMEQEAIRKDNRFFPPGYDGRWEVAILSVLLLTAALLTLPCLTAIDKVRTLFVVEEGVAAKTGSELSHYWLAYTENTFWGILNGRFAGFIILCAGCIVVALLHYVFFTKESQSIYVMKRLGSGKEMRRRCLFVPVLFALAGIVLMGLLILGYRMFYNASIPAQFREYGTFRFFRLFF